MHPCKRILKRILFLPVPLILPLAVTAAVLLICAFTCENVDPWITYTAYFLSAYALTVVCAAVPRLVRFIGRIKKNNRYIRRWIQDVHLRMKLALYAAVTVNALYALIQLVYGLYNHSVWFYALSAYYVLLAIMRFLLLKQARRKEQQTDGCTEYRLYRLCGRLLLIMNLTLGILVASIVQQNRGFAYHEITTIAMAAYTFYSVTLAIVQAAGDRKRNQPVLSASRVINLAAALVSILSLETVMLNTFGQENNETFRRSITALTGTGVCVTVLVMAIFMMIHSTREINRIKGELNDG